MTEMRRTRQLGRLIFRACTAAFHDGTLTPSRSLRTAVVASSSTNTPQQDHEPRRNSNKRSWWALAISAAAAAAAAIPQRSHNGSETLEPEALRELADDLHPARANPDRERAAAMLSSLTVFLEHHPALLDAGVLPALMATVMDRNAVPQVRVIALGCAADLLKDGRAKQAAASQPDFIPTLLQALQARDGWEAGPEEGGIARAQAARALAELAAEPNLHPLLTDSGAIAALASQGAEMAEESDTEDKTYSSLSEVPGTMVERHDVETERYNAAALYGLAGSKEGIAGLLAGGDGGRGSMRGLGRWAASNDPVLQRYAAGALARVASSGVTGFGAVRDSGALLHLVHAMACGDPQVRCFAAGAVGHIAEVGGDAVVDLLRAGAVPHVLAMLQPPVTASVVGGDSFGVRRGVYRCALRALLRGLRNDHFRKALVEGGAADALKEFMASADASVDGQLRDMAQAVLEGLE